MLSSHIPPPFSLSLCLLSFFSLFFPYFLVFFSPPIQPPCLLPVDHQQQQQVNDLSTLSLPPPSFIFSLSSFNRPYFATDEYKSIRLIRFIYFIWSSSSRSYGEVIEKGQGQGQTKTRKSKKKKKKKRRNISAQYGF